MPEMCPLYWHFGMEGCPRFFKAFHEEDAGKIAGSKELHTKN